MISIFLSEEQTLRNYFLTNSWRSLPLSYSYLLICTNDTLNTVSELSKRNEIPFRHIIVSLNKPIIINNVSRVIIGILRNLSPSSSVYRHIRKERALLVISFPKYVLRLIWYKLSFVILFVSKLLRFILLVSTNSNELSAILAKYKIECAISVSITNSSDAAYLICARKLGIYSIGTTRSWDNLSSHGSILVEPDAFINHSQFMRAQMLLFQNLSKNCSIWNFKIPLYDDKSNSILKKTYRKVLHNEKTNLKVLYACTGSYHFPNELEYAVELNNILVNFGYDFSILQHPKSMHEIEQFELSSKTFVFPYINEQLQSTVKNYYDFLNRFDLIIGSGSTVLLDSCYLGIPVVGFFPNNTNNFWTSISRYSDYMYHYSEFLDKMKIPIFSEARILVDFVSNKDVDFQINLANLEFFTGGYEPLIFSKIIDQS